MEVCREIPDLEFDAVVGDRFDVKTNGGDGGDDRADLEAVENGRFSGVIQSKNENSSFFLAKHGEEATEKETHLPLFFYKFSTFCVYLFLFRCCPLCDEFTIQQATSSFLFLFLCVRFVYLKSSTNSDTLSLRAPSIWPLVLSRTQFGCIKIWREGRSIQRLGGGKRRKANEKDRTTSRREILFFSFSCTYRHYNSDQVSKRMNHHQNTTTRHKRK